MSQLKLMLSTCPCGSQRTYLDCCSLYIEELQPAPTPEILMRSRYTAYTKANIDYIKATMRGKPLINFNDYEAEKWAKQVKWIGLEVTNTYSDAKEKECKFVEFIATYEIDGRMESIHEKSEFRRYQGKWFYTDSLKPSQSKKSISRNKPCPCGSQKKNKNCHGSAN